MNSSSRIANSSMALIFIIFLFIPLLHLARPWPVGGHSGEENALNPVVVHHYGRLDCSDASSEPKFRCSNTSCIPMHWKCDGFIDCPNGLDENDCGDTTGETATDNADQAALSSSAPSDWQQRSLAIAPCTDDEYRCSSSDDECVPRAMVCDGKNDCSDKSDEHNCTHYLGSEADECKKHDSFWCDDPGICLPNSWLCDGGCEVWESWVILSVSGRRV